MSDINIPKPILTNETYERSKWTVQLVLPLVSSVYFLLSRIFDWDHPDTVLGVLAIVATLVGIALKISSNNYFKSHHWYDGEMVIVADKGGVRTFSLEVNGDPDDLAHKKVITFKVRKTSVPEPPTS